MTIRTKIIISNLLIVFTPFVLLFAMGTVWINTAGKRYWKPIEEMYEDSNGMISAQNLIYAYQEELWDTNWAELEEQDEGPADGQLKQSAEMIRLRKQLTDLGYHFSVQVDGKTLYSNLSEEERSQAAGFLYSLPPKARSITIGNEDVSVIRCSFQEDQEECSITAVSLGAAEGGSGPSYLQTHEVPYIWLFGISTLIVVLIVNGSCARWITSLIIPPLKEIRKGMQQVRSGAEGEEIQVIRRDELGEVCTEFNEMHRWLKRSRQEQQKYEAYRKEMISSISHDLRTPLTTIRGYVDGILDGIADTEEKRRRYLLAVHTRAEDLENLVNKLSAYNAKENAVFPYHMEKADLGSYIRTYLEENAEFIRENRIETVLDCGEGLCVLLDRKEFKRIFDNLFTNSVRYRKKSGSRIEITAQRRDGHICLAVGDDGPGVEEKDLERIFESFCRLEESRTDCGEGSGLGLAIVRRIVLDHQGTVYARRRGGLEICMEFPDGDAICGASPWR